MCACGGVRENLIPWSFDDLIVNLHHCNINILFCKNIGTSTGANLSTVLLIPNCPERFKPNTKEKLKEEEKLRNQVERAAVKIDFEDWVSEMCRMWMLSFLMIDNLSFKKRVRVNLVYGNYVMVFAL